MKTKSIMTIAALSLSALAFAQNQPDSIHIVIHENQNGNERTLDTIVPVAQQQSLFLWMEQNGYQAPPPPPPPGAGPMTMEHVIVLEGDSSAEGERNVIVIMNDSMMPPPPPGTHPPQRVMIMRNGPGDGSHPAPPMPPGPHPKGSQVTVDIQERDTVINGEKHKVVVKKETIILPPAPPAPPVPLKAPGTKPEMQRGLVVYPNPSDAIINVEFDVQAKQKTVLSVRDANGKTVYTERITMDQPQRVKREINLADKGKGTFVVEVNSGDKVIAEKVILK
ncbi:MAG: T9SS type A sorting domain-containing protein [Bacteroidia bacterium]|nr:T9SS type A sorting domain-containing protein [Bacteroidia bacterium]